MPLLNLYFCLLGLPPLRANIQAELSFVSWTAVSAFLKKYEETVRQSLRVEHRGMGIRAGSKRGTGDGERTAGKKSEDPEDNSTAIAASCGLAP